MKDLKNKLFLVGASLLLISIIFSAGLFVGNNSNFNIKSIVGEKVSASVDVDLDTFWKVWDLLDSKYIPASTTKELTDQDKIFGAISGMVNSLEDPYTIFLEPQENETFRESIEGNFSGVGMEVGMEGDKITVISPLKNTPAEKSGIQSGDVVVEVDGISVIGMSLDQVVNKIRGPVGSEVKLAVVRESESELVQISIIRDIIDIPVLDWELRDDGVFVISLYNFSANSASEFRKALREFVSTGSNELILDLRGNPGGYLDAAVDIASWFLPAGKAIVQEDFGTDENKILRSKGYDIFDDNLDMVILVNRGSASASEILSGALSEYGVAKIVGTKTFGKGSVQELVSVTSDTSLKVTIARWLTPNGVSISDGGLEPDIYAGIEDLPENSQVLDVFEYQFQKALEILKAN